MTSQQLLPPLQRPDWATRRDVDEGLVEFSRSMGAVPAIDGYEPEVEVVVIEQHELDFNAEPPALTRHDPAIRINGVRFTAGQIRELVAILGQSADLAESISTVEGREADQDGANPASLLTFAE
jgi:hypothetical protein